ncbi:hypothetical protein [Peredibacter starrii]|uniref:Uncharacterized protein n=1 Tax=Peredibacter starrii TaxID=28202 RepID=A0AAX4HJG5_9BACT|nr:hypothetical protein [Peredibacter starrii]WPU63367.1 hypothetical protein SOO65_11785 [Peredibacter starrii]
MKHFSKILKNQAGVSLLFTIMIVALALGGLGYVTTEMLPKLHSEKKKAESTIDYRVFISSLNDYLIHGIRERWCLSVNNGVTDLLLSNDCGSGKAMEDIVTHPGNLERILWGPENIGTPLNAMPSAESANRILALNYVRYHQTPQKASRLLAYEDVYPTDGKMKFKVTQAILQDMTDQHPLYLISKSVRDCVNEVNIEIFQVKDYNNIGAGEERKIGINITTDISRTRFSCTVMRTADSTAYYTFYPRRLHTFSLIKYGNLDTKALNEFRGPVYVAGDLVLPPEGYDKDQGSVFYAPLVLGMYNSGGGTGSTFRAGRVVNSNGADYTFNDRGHPHLSKQDNYPNFRGFLGGLNLDATEDKGFYNLYNHASQTAVNQALLEQCIEETKVQTTPSMNNNSRLGFTNYDVSSNGSKTTKKILLGFNLRNRFKPSSMSPDVISEEDNSGNWWGGGKKDPIIVFSIPTPPPGLTSLGEFRLKNDDRSLRGTIGVGSEARMELDLSKLDVTENKIKDLIKSVEDAKKNNFYNAIQSDHIFSQLQEYKKFKDEGEDFKDECEEDANSDCVDWGFSKKDACLFGSCNDTEDAWDDYKDARKDLVNKLNELKDDLKDANKKPMASFQLANHTTSEGFVLNMKTLSFTYNQQWSMYFNMAKNKMSNDEKNLRFDFWPYHYGQWSRYVKLKISGDDGNDLTLITDNGYQYNNLSVSNWRKTDNYDNFSGDPDDKWDPRPKEIYDLSCPSGMGIADWDLDMSGSTNFAWNYANTPPGAQVDTPNHDPISSIEFTMPTDNSPILEGHAASFSKSVVEECIIPPNRNRVYGFYVCNKLVIQGGRSEPLYMIGTFIVKDLIQPVDGSTQVHWHSIWDTKATDLVMTDFSSSKGVCQNTNLLMSYTWKDLKESPAIMARVNACSPMDMVSNGPNNFSWTTVDPDIGIANPGDAMTSQKVNRIQKWVIREDSRVDMIR